MFTGLFNNFNSTTVFEYLLIVSFSSQCDKQTELSHWSKLYLYKIMSTVFNYKYGDNANI